MVDVECFVISKLNIETDRTNHSQIIWSDKFSLVSRYLSVIIQSFVYGSVFYNMQTNLSGLFTRGGAIFAAILFNAFLSEGELFALMALQVKSFTKTTFLFYV
ncbi:hypothetical protein ACTFIR_009077 [Dictyostelium discoideum]